MTGKELYEAFTLARLEVHGGNLVTPWDDFSDEHRRLYEIAAQSLQGGTRTFVVAVSRPSCTYAVKADSEAAAEELALDYYRQDEAAGLVDEIEAHSLSTEDAMNTLASGNFTERRPL